MTAPIQIRARLTAASVFRNTGSDQIRLAALEHLDPTDDAAANPFDAELNITLYGSMCGVVQPGQRFDLLLVPAGAPYEPPVDETSPWPRPAELAAEPVDPS